MPWLDFSGLRVEGFPLEMSEEVGEIVASREQECTSNL